MGFRFRKSFGAGPFRVNLSKSGIGYSVGTKGIRYTKKAGGGTRTTASIPGTGVSYVQESGSSGKRSASNQQNFHYQDPRQTQSNTNIKRKRKTYRIFFVFAVLYLFVLPTSARSSIAAVIINLAFIAGFAYFGIKNYRICKSQENYTASLDVDMAASPKRLSQNLEPVFDNTPPVSSSPVQTSRVGKTHKVAGVSYYTENIMKLASENEDYNLTKRELVDEGLTDEKIWKYQFFPGETELIPEPDNPEDPNAIKVVVDGLKIGYIKAGSCSHVLKVLRENRCLGVDCEIYGGPYKIVYEDYDDEKDKDVYTMEKDEHSFAVTLTMYEK